MSASICIVDYGVGNTHSVKNALNRLGYRSLISSCPKKLARADMLILPGVGAFDEAMRNLRQRGLDQALNELVREQKKPILGICVGMQMLSTYSDENGRHEGLDWIPGAVTKLSPAKTFRIPHVGWNEIDVIKKEPLFTRSMDQSHFYFDHSYQFDCDSSYIAATANYGVSVTAAVQCDNIAGVQFHPEKSQNNGLRLFRSFVSSMERVYLHA